MIIRSFFISDVKISVRRKQTSSFIVYYGKVFAHYISICKFNIYSHNILFLTVPNFLLTKDNKSGPYNLRFEAVLKRYSSEASLKASMIAVGIP